MSEALTLTDGRRLEVRVAGPADGPVVIFHHGTPGSAVPFRVLESAVTAHGARFVTYSRPGYGSSDRREGRSVADVAGDMLAVLDHLGADRCVTAGWSGGGPHALVTGALLDGRVTGVLSIAGVAPYDADGLDWLDGMGEDNIAEFGNALAGADSLRPFLDGAARELQGADAAGLVQAMATLLPQVDRDAIDAAYGEDLLSGFREGLARGVDGWLDDDLAFLRPWGFDLDRLAVPALIWQGSADLMVPYAHGQWLAEHVPTATPHLIEGEGHLSVALGRADEMFAELLTTLG